MKILIDGNHREPITEEPEIFKCASCRCVFAAYPGEYTEADSVWGVSSACCPQCLNKAFLHHLDTYERELIGIEF